MHASLYSCKDTYLVKKKVSEFLCGCLQGRPIQPPGPSGRREIPMRRNRMELRFEPPLPRGGRSGILTRVRVHRTGDGGYMACSHRCQAVVLAAEHVNVASPPSGDGATWPKAQLHCQAVDRSGTHNIARPPSGDGGYVATSYVCWTSQ